MAERRPLGPPGLLLVLAQQQGLESSSRAGSVPPGLLRLLRLPPSKRLPTCCTSLMMSGDSGL